MNKQYQFDNLKPQTMTRITMRMIQFNLISTIGMVYEVTLPQTNIPHCMVYLKKNRNTIGSIGKTAIQPMKCLKRK